MGKDKEPNESLLTKKEWVEYVDKLINRASANYCILLNQKATLILKKEPLELKRELDEIIRGWHETQRNLKKNMKKVNDIKRSLIKNHNKKEVNGGMVV